MEQVQEQCSRFKAGKGVGRRQAARVRSEEGEADGQEGERERERESCQRKKRRVRLCGLPQPGRKQGGSGGRDGIWQGMSVQRRCKEGAREKAQ